MRMMMIMFRYFLLHVHRECKSYEALVGDKLAHHVGMTIDYFVEYTAVDSIHSTL